MDAIRSRRSVREYSAEALDEKAIARLIDAAVQAPNAMNRQAWLFVVVTDRLRLDLIAGRAKAQMLATFAKSPMPQHVGEHLAREEFDIFYGAPALVVICTTAADEMGRHDCALAAENLMLAAHAQGLGSCWIGFAESWLAQPEARIELDLPEGAHPVAPIILGHPRNPAVGPGRRAPQIRWVRQ